MASIHHLCHLSLTLHSLPPTSPWSSTHSALLTILPPRPLHTLTPLQPSHPTYLVQVGQRLRLEKLSLPPEDSRDEEEGQGKKRSGVGGGGGVGGEGGGEKVRGKVEVEGVEEEKRAGMSGGAGERGHHRHGGGMSCGSTGKGGKPLLDF